MVIMATMAIIITMMAKFVPLLHILSLTVAVIMHAVAFANPDVATLAQGYGKKRPLITGDDHQPIILEAEEFRILAPETPGWRARNWGTNYYASTFANTFLSRKAYLSAPEQSGVVVATRQVLIPKSGRYAVLARYEVAYRFETRFRIEVEQNDQSLFMRQYGARENAKIWAFGQKVKSEVTWPWGAVENIVWEGHQAFVYLNPGMATVKLYASGQPQPAARRNIDLIMLTPDIADVQRRIEAESYLPLDGLLTQSGDLAVRVQNHRNDSVLVLHIPPGTEHSPYWVHQRVWKAKKVLLEPGKRTDWIEVGSLLDTLNDGQWKLKAKGYPELDYSVEVGLLEAGQYTRIGNFRSGRETLLLAYDANTRYTRRIRLQEDVLYDLVTYLKDHPVRGQPPTQTQVYALTFDEQPEHERYMKARDEFIHMMGIIPTNRQSLTNQNQAPGYVDVRWFSDDELERQLQRVKESDTAENIAIVSVGDEIKLQPPKDDDNAGFRQWLQHQEMKPSDVTKDAGDDWQQIRYDPKSTDPRLFFFAQRYRHDYGIDRLKARTALIRTYLPHAAVGANFSPHHGASYLGETHKWVRLFREGALTMPWSEDFIWQVPVGSPQMNTISLDQFRAALKGKPRAKIQFYVMPHAPGNTPAMWRRQFYGDLAHGMNIVNLFELRPVQAAYTENHVSSNEMYLEVRRALHELGTFEDIVQDGQVAPGTVGIWFSEVSDIWNGNEPPYAAAKRSLYIAIKHQQLPLDVVTEADALAGDLKHYRILYLADRHVSRAASEAIAKWVASGGRLFATVGAGTYDEFNQPNLTFHHLLGLDHISIDQGEDTVIRYIKQDLPYARVMDQVTWLRSNTSIQFPIFGVRSQVKPRPGALIHGVFQDGSPAIVLNNVDRGQTLYCGFMPGLSYFRPAIPRRVIDRGTTYDAMNHFLPTDFDPSVFALMNWLSQDLPRPIFSSHALAEVGMIHSEHGRLMPIVNWSGRSIPSLQIEWDTVEPIESASLASGQELVQKQKGGKWVFEFELEASADALILR